MPTYEYACRDCGEHLEVVQSFRDDPLTVCPACEGRLRKVFSAAPIVFKGSGWHSKDYGPSGAKSGKARTGDASSSRDNSGGTAASEGSGSDRSGGESSGGTSSSGTGDEARSA